MESKYIEERFNNLITCDNFICTSEEFNDFQNYGYLIPAGNLYLTRMGKKVNVNIINQKASNMTINLTGIIYKGLEFADKHKYKRLYCMSEKTYIEYKHKGLIVEKNNNNYYRYFDGELWLVMII